MITALSHALHQTMEHGNVCERGGTHVCANGNVCVHILLNMLNNYFVVGLFVCLLFLYPLFLVQMLPFGDVICEEILLPTAEILLKMLNFQFNMWTVRVSIKRMFSNKHNKQIHM